jgi:hypothetical protein
VRGDPEKNIAERSRIGRVEGSGEGKARKHLQDDEFVDYALNRSDLFYP